MFVPTPSYITGITNANPGVVTTASDHGLVTGQVVRINLPLPYGMQQLNKQVAIITVLSATTFSLHKTLAPFVEDINTTNFDPFVTPASEKTRPQVVPVGSGPIFNSQGIVETKLDDQVDNIATVNIPF